MNSFTNARTTHAQTMRSINQHEFEPMFGERPATNGTARRKALTDADIAKAHAEGFAEGVAQTQASLDRASNDSLRAIASLMQMMLGRLHDEAQSLRTDAAEVALAGAKVVAGCALDTFGEEAIASIVSTAVAQLRDAPRLVVRVTPDLVERIDLKLAACAKEAGFNGEIVVRGDPEAAIGDCTLDWGDGVIIVNREAAFAAIEKAGRDWLAGAQSEGFQIDLFDN